MAFSFTRFLKGLNIREENTVTPKEIDIVPGGTSGTKTTITTSQTANRTITLPDATTTLTSTDSAQVLTNKTIDADLNTITNIDDNEIRGGAAINVTKLADGSVTNTEFQYINTVTSNVQDQLDSKAPAATAVTLSGTQTLQNKTLDNTNTINVKDTLLTIEDDGDDTKKMRFQASGITTGTTRTFAVPDADTTLVGTGTTQTLSNKTIDNTNIVTVQDANLTIQDNVDTTKQVKIQASAITTGTTRTIVIPDADTTMVGTDTAQTLTNKNISGASNTITNINAATSLTGAVPIANGGTGQTTQTEAFDALAPSTTKGDIIVHNGTDNIRVAVGADETTLVADSTQASGVKWAPAQAGLKNYVLNAGAEANLNGWITYADTAGVAPVDGTGGSPVVTLTRSTSSPLRGTASFLMTKDAANRQGEGVSYAFTIDSADQAKVLKISMDYAITSGTYSGGTPTTNSDVLCYIYDVTNAQVIQPAGFKLDGGVIGQKYQVNATFQSNSNSTSYRLIFHVASTSTSAYTMQFDNVYVTPQFVSNGSMVGDWIPFTPTGTFTTNTTYTGLYRRVGGDIEIQYRMTFQGAPNAVNCRLNMPNGLKYDISRMEPPTPGAGGTQNYLFGQYQYYRNGAALNSGMFGVVGPEQSDVGGTNSILSLGRLAPQTTAPAMIFDAGGINNTTPYTIGNGDQIFAQVKVPVLGWSSSQVLSSETDTRVVSARGYLSGTQSIPDGSATAVVWNIKSFDTHNALDTSNGRFTAPVPGYYRLSAGILVANSINIVTGNRMGIYYTVNGGSDSVMTYLPFTGSSFDQPGVSGSDTVYLNAGDWIAIRTYLDFGSGSYNIGASGSGANYFAIERISGPSQIAASEAVFAQVNGNAAAASANNPIIFPTTVRSSHGSYNGTTGQFTAPIAGWYDVSGYLNGSNPPSNTTISAYVNGTIQAPALGFITNALGQGAFGGKVYALAGQTIDVRSSQNYGAFSSSNNGITFIKVSN